MSDRSKPGGKDPDVSRSERRVVSVPTTPGEAWRWLAVLPGLTPRSRQELLEKAGGPVQAVAKLLAGGVPEVPAPPSPREWNDLATRARRRLRAAGARGITFDDPDYPEVLREISDPPPVLYVRGRIPERPGVAIVGSRECSRYGRDTARRLAMQLVAEGMTVVSGLARGVDAAAHRGALAGGGDTVAVLPSGPDRIYPGHHTALARRIRENGALVTEFPPGHQVAPWSFPVRNRLIAGLSWVTVVVEAARRSGALITARLAQEANREVVAVPGPITSATSVGANWLLSEGGHPCRGPEDVLAQMPPEIVAAARERVDGTRSGREAAIDGLEPAERRCLASLPSSGSRSLGRLAAATGLPIPRLLATLTALEVKGLVRPLEGQRFERDGPAGNSS